MLFCLPPSTHSQSFFFFGGSLLCFLFPYLPTQYHLFLPFGGDVSVSGWREKSGGLNYPWAAGLWHSEEIRTTKAWINNAVPLWTAHQREPSQRGARAPETNLQPVRICRASANRSLRNKYKLQSGLNPRRKQGGDTEGGTNGFKWNAQHAPGAVSSRLEAEPQSNVDFVPLSTYW